MGDIHLPFKRNKDEKILQRMHDLSLQILQGEQQVGKIFAFIERWLTRSILFRSSDSINDGVLDRQSGEATVDQVTTGDPNA